jgi:hypothetical protein
MGCGNSAGDYSVAVDGGGIQPLLRSLAWKSGTKSRKNKNDMQIVIVFARANIAEQSKQVVSPT